MKIQSGGTKTLTSFGSIADGASYLVPRCRLRSEVTYMGGWVKHKTKWNVAVYWTGC